MTFADIEPNPASGDVGRKLKNAYQQLGIHIRVYNMPRKRALIAANQGQFDGVVARSATVAETYNNLIVVPNPVLYIPVRVYGKAGSKWISSLEDLKTLRIGITLGTPYLEKKLSNMAYTQAKTPTQLIKMINSNRIYVAIISEPLAKHVINKEKFINISEISGRIFYVPVYHLLHRRHRALIPVISKVISETNFNN